MRAQFSQATLRDGKVEVSGPVVGDQGMQVKHLRFMIAQDGVMVEDVADVPGDGSWTGETPAQGLEEGPAHAFGLAVLMAPQAPARYETFAWFEEVRLTT